MNKIETLQEDLDSKCKITCSKIKHTVANSDVVELIAKQCFLLHHSMQVVMC